MGSPAEDFQAFWGTRFADGPVGHAHFFERAMSRRQFVGRTAGAAGALVLSSLWVPALANAAPPGPGVANPIPGGTTLPFGLFHFYFPEANPFSTATIENGEGDPSTITDFNGFVGVGEFAGGTGTDGEGTTLYWNADVRFMSGQYVGADGRHRGGAFAFV